MVAEPVAPSFVHVYDGVALPEGSTRGLAAFLQQEIRAAAVGVRAGFLRYWLGADGEQERRAARIAQDLARARVRQPDRQEPDRDPRLPEAIKGYLLQALFYHVTGDPFCDSKECRLFNAHWQEELIHAQMRPGADLCERHRQMVEKWACK